MKPTIIILGLLIAAAGCGRPTSSEPAPASAASLTCYDMAIENLSTTTEQLESIRREKDFFVKSFEDFERQKAQYGQLWTSRQIRNQMQYFTDWHRDILQRERTLEFQHALNVLAAHNEVIKRKKADTNQIEDLEGGIREIIYTARLVRRGTKFAP